jgi:diacylglycerol kinase (ATP)
MIEKYNCQIDTRSVMKNKQPQSFSLRARRTSIRYAYEGLLAFFTNEHNAIVHLFFTIAVFAAAIIVRVTGMEMIALILATSFVWAAEIFNTAIEAAMDHLAPEKHPRVKFIKDVSAAAVLLAAATAVVVGLFIFIPKLF